MQTFDGVVATGGGVVERPENLEILRHSPATIIYLHGNLESTIGRLILEGQRPLLQEKSTANSLHYGRNVTQSTKKLPISP